jgi:hypothetical protein
MNKQRSQCPASSCSAGDPAQMTIEASDLQRIGLSDNWTGSAMRCVYCKVIYSIDGNGRKTVRGYFEGDLMEPGRWRPVKL